MTETWHLIGAPARLEFMRWVAAGGVAVLEAGTDAETPMLALLEKYRDRRMDLADASLVLLAERVGVDEILTIDRADFDIYRLPRGRRFIQVLQE